MRLCIAPPVLKNSRAWNGVARKGIPAEWLGLEDEYVILTPVKPGEESSEILRFAQHDGEKNGCRHTSFPLQGGRSGWGSTILHKMPPTQLFILASPFQVEGFMGITVK